MMKFCEEILRYFMKINFVMIGLIFSLAIMMGFIIGFEPRASMCSMPDISSVHPITNSSVSQWYMENFHCPSVCECGGNISSPECQVSGCSHLYCVKWYWVCLYKWR